MNRSDFLQFEQTAGPARRSLATEIEWRQLDGGKRLLFRGHASTTEQPYDVYGGTFPGWVETMARGAFKRTIKNNADVVFLINHEGMALAGTRAGTLDLEEDSVGLADAARLNPKVSAVSDLYELTGDGTMTEQSFAFRVVQDAWFDDDGDPADEQTGTHRRILEVNMNRGDVSAVNFGANPNTSGGFRSEELFLAELRDGRLPVNEALHALAQTVRAQMDPMTAVESELATIVNSANNIRTMLAAEANAESDENAPLLQNADVDPVLAVYLARHADLAQTI